jgi:hypothetical protein
MKPASSSRITLARRPQRLWHHNTSRNYKRAQIHSPIGQPLPRVVGQHIESRGYRMNKARLAGVAGIAFVTIAPVHAADLAYARFTGTLRLSRLYRFSHGPAAISEAMRAGDGLTRRYPFRR